MANDPKVTPETGVLDINGRLKVHDAVHAGEVPSYSQTVSLVNLIVLNDVVVSTQTDFEALFDGTKLENISIYLKKKTDQTSVNDGDYSFLLDNEIPLGSNVSIQSNGAIVRRNDESARFITSYKHTMSATSATNVFTVLSAPDDFNVGDILYWDQTSTNNTNPSSNYRQHYTIVDITGMDITVNIDIEGITASGNIYSLTERIDTNGWIFDGYGGVNGLPGGLEVSNDGGAFNVEYCGNSKFNAEVTNSLLSALSGHNGGAYYGGNTTFNLEINNVNNCATQSILSGGGGLSHISHSDINNISFCSSSNGGGLYSICESNINNISNSIASAGGGIHTIFNSKVTNITYNTANSGGGIQNAYNSLLTNISKCKALTGTGGGVSHAFLCEIDTITFCDANYGGGVSSGDDNNITNINRCNATVQGGGVYGEEYSTINGVEYCSAGGNGKAIGSCNYVTILGHVNRTNTTDINIQNCLSSNILATVGNTNRSDSNVSITY